VRLPMGGRAGNPVVTDAPRTGEGRAAVASAGVADGDEYRGRQAGAIYGQVVSTSTVAALALDED
jgi:hypothetical protein